MTGEKPAPMIVYVSDSEDTLWSIAKKFKTTSENIAALNNLEEEELCCGKKLLILR